MKVLTVKQGDYNYELECVEPSYISGHASRLFGPPNCEGCVVYIPKSLYHNWASTGETCAEIYIPLRGGKWSNLPAELVCADEPSWNNPRDPARWLLVYFDDLFGEYCDPVTREKIKKEADPYRSDS